MIEATDNFEKRLSQLSDHDQTQLREVSLVIQNLIEHNPELNNEELKQTSHALGLQLVELDADIDMLSAAMLYPYVTPSEHTQTLITQKINASVYALLTGVKRMEEMDKLDISEAPSRWSQKQLDHLSAMLLAIVDDVRIVVIKLAERIHALRALRKTESDKRQQLAKQTMSLYAPLANRLGLGQLKWQLEDWSFRYLDAENYKKISQELKQRRQDRDHFISQVQDDLDHLIRQAGLKRYEITGRAKHIYSIFRKIQRKHLSFDQIYDTNAFRILVPTVEDCYRCLSLIHEKWPHIQREFDDYISKPKPNGYQSIHTIVAGPEERYVEIQIRTFDMNQAAELGVAAHWKYKESRKDNSYENKFHLLREMMEWQLELTESSNEKSKVFNNIFADRVYVFTPNNHIIDLPLGATPLDAAYYIHTDVGHRCKGAKVNHKMVPLTHKVQTGDIIEILTSPDHKPSRDWLNPERGYLKSKVAINKVKNWFSRQFRQEKLTKGEQLWEKMAKREGFNATHLSQLVEHFQFKNNEDLLVALGSGNISTHALSRQLKPDLIVEENHNIDLAYIAKRSTATASRIQGAESLLTQLAKCCQPIPGDLIVGYITKGRGVAVHRQNCQNFLNSIKYRPERVLELSWGDKHEHKYPVNLYIEAMDHPGLIRDITAVFTHQHIPLLGLHSRVDTLTGRAYIELTIEVMHQEALHQTLTHLQQLPQTIKVERA